MIGRLIRNAKDSLDFYNDLQNLSFCQKKLFIDLHIKKTLLPKKKSSHKILREFLSSNTVRERSRCEVYVSLE